MFLQSPHTSPFLLLPYSKLPNTPSYGHFLLQVFLSIENPDFTFYTIWGLSKIDTEVPTISLQNVVIKIWNKMWTLNIYINFLLLRKKYHKLESLKEYHLLSNRSCRSQVQIWVSSSAECHQAEIKVFSVTLSPCEMCSLLQVYSDCWQNSDFYWRLELFWVPTVLCSVPLIDSSQYSCLLSPLAAEKFFSCLHLFLQKFLVLLRAILIRLWTLPSLIP